MRGVKRRFIKAKANHKWPTPPPGYAFFMLGPGDVHLFAPSGWNHTIEESGWMRISDNPPPDENCRLKLMSGAVPAVPKTFEFEQFVASHGKQMGKAMEVEFSAPVFCHRNGLLFGWYETHHTDRFRGRSICNRTLYAMGNGIQANVIFECWADETEKYLPVWDMLLKSIKLGEYVPDLTTGRVVRPNLN